VTTILPENSDDYKGFPESCANWGQRLYRHVALQLAAMRALNLAHPARAQARNDAIGTELALAFDRKNSIARQSWVYPAQGSLRKADRASRARSRPPAHGHALTKTGIIVEREWFRVACPSEPRRKFQAVQEG